ncbi:hypothetical protein [Bdellovibrio bacteriovorus]|uniref:hypothetical protein n=1 Tax=Bdellovibrio bacteriovorus TaxID=959 RepID=UPI0035A70E0F
MNLQIRTYEAFKLFLDSQKVDKIYFFNGRFSLYRPLLRAAQFKKIDFFTHERGSTNNKYHLSHNTYPHDLPYRKAEIQELWRTATPEQKDAAGKWFDFVRGGKALSWYSFVGHQQNSTADIQFYPNKINVGIFISSEDEMICISGWENNLFKYQSEILEWLAQEFDSSDEVHFIVRVHPNLAGLKNTQTNFLKNSKTRTSLLSLGNL